MERSARANAYFSNNYEQSVLIMFNILIIEYFLKIVRLNIEY